MLTVRKVLIMADKLRWGILATGNIAHNFSRGVIGSRTGELAAVASRSQAKAETFGDEFGIPARYGGYEAMLDDPNVDIVYVAVPHPLHGEWAIKAAEAGKHVLVEKPIAMNRSDAEAIVDAAQRNDVFLMEAFMYRCHPQMAHLRKCLEDGVIGDVQMIVAGFGFQAHFDPKSRLFAPELGGGAILDVGCYTASGARFAAGAASGKLFENPLEVKGTGTLASTGVDGCAAAVLKFPNGIIAQLATAVTLNIGEQNSLRVIGSEGEIIVPVPWLPSRQKSPKGEVIIKRHDQPVENVKFTDDTDLYSYEVDTVAEHIADRQAPQMSWDDSLGNMAVLDAWRRELGV